MARRSAGARRRSPSASAAGTWKATPYEDASTATQIDPRTLSAALDDLLPEDRTLAVDSGHFMGYPPMYLRVPDAQGFVFTQAFQAIGLGLASAIGAAVARPDRLTVAALGDGGAMMALPELETVARLGLRMLIVVYNDAAYGAEVHHFGPQGHPVELVQFPDVDFAALARAAGLEGATIRRREDLDVVTSWLAGWRRARPAAGREGRADRRRRVAGGGVPGPLTARSRPCHRDVICEASSPAGGTPTTAGAICAWTSCAATPSSR